jgi:thiol:disulfide interchange protein
MKLARRSALGLWVALFLAYSGVCAAEPPSPQSAPWSAQKVIDARNAGKIVFVAFRADWCVVCRLNELTVFRTAEVRAALAQANVEYLVADYTNKNNPAIKHQLEYYQAGALPMYLVFRPDQRRPAVLQQMPGKKDVIEALR